MYYKNIDFGVKYYNYKKKFLNSFTCLVVGWASVVIYNLLITRLLIDKLDFCIVQDKEWYFKSYIYADIS